MYKRQAKTTNQIYNDARTFAIEVSNLDNFNKKVEESGLTKRIATIGKNDKTIAGMESAREMIRQAYMAEEVDVYKRQGQYSIFQISGSNSYRCRQIPLHRHTIHNPHRLHISCQRIHSTNTDLSLSSGSSRNIHDRNTRQSSPEHLVYRRCV